MRSAVTLCLQLCRNPLRAAEMLFCMKFCRGSDESAAELLRQVDVAVSSSVQGLLPVVSSVDSFRNTVTSPSSDRSFLWNGADPRSACLFTAQTSHSASLSRTHRQPGCSQFWLSDSVHARLPSHVLACISVHEHLNFLESESVYCLLYIIFFFFLSLKPTQPQM